MDNAVILVTAHQITRNRFIARGRRNDQVGVALAHHRTACNARGSESSYGLPLRYESSTSTSAMHLDKNFIRIYIIATLLT